MEVKSGAPATWNGSKPLASGFLSNVCGSSPTLTVPGFPFSPFISKRLALSIKSHSFKIPQNARARRAVLVRQSQLIKAETFW